MKSDEAQEIPVFPSLSFVVDFFQTQMKVEPTWTNDNGKWFNQYLTNEEWEVGY